MKASERTLLYKNRQTTEVKWKSESYFATDGRSGSHSPSWHWATLGL